MLTNCPTCGKEVDTLRARAVSVRDGKVIAFCSLECKAAAETRPVAAPVVAAAAAAVPVVAPADAKIATGPVAKVDPKVATGPVPKVELSKSEAKKAAKEDKKKRVSDESAVI